ncbi:MAG: hypothetical protein GVY12_13840 [Bacteroidetes bacterium]|jgi:hypothetical protein|nr:hypothetical protein [Bacteroidota bacterium]
MMLSIGLGAMVGVAYGLSAYATLRYAAQFQGTVFMQIFMGGMIARIVGLMIGVGLIAALLPIKPLPFLLTLVVLLIGTVVAEVREALRMVNKSSTPAS